MTTLPPRLTAAELRQARAAGFRVPSRMRAVFGSMFSWFPSLQFGRATYWPSGANAKPPVNAAPSDAGQIITPASALTLSAFWACVWLNARTLATLPLYLTRYDRNGHGTHETTDPLFDVLRWKPNALMTAVNFWTFLWANEQLWGTGYAEKKYSAGKVIALEPLLSEWMTPYLTDKGLLRFRYDEPQNPREFRADQIFRVMSRTLDGITGASVIEFGRHSFGLAQAGEQAAGNTFRNGLQAGGFIKVDKFLKTEQRAMFRSEIESFTGPKGKQRGGVMVLEGGTDFKELTIKPQDAELLLSRQFSVEDVCRWTNTPPVLIGHSAQGQTMWGSGIEQIFSGWLRLGLRPSLEACRQEIRSSLIPAADRQDVFAEYDLDELLAPDSQARANLYSTFGQNGIMTRNEMREREGLPRADGGDTLTVQSNLVPLDQLGKATQNGQTPAAEQLRNALLNFLDVAKQTPPASKTEGKP